ncbi:MAG TPA: zinc ribbon domain-containing protein [Longimicrobium sp.]|jgi:putative FmdB family regulatory protein|uniref:FmdB family zinc ribbon protein n=1 Tax=Longimicrobium sp. TaxID=2029185 RepID=UPI002EDB69D3
MPTYEYRCPQCGNDFEKFQKMSDEPVAECPACGTQAQRRISAGAGLVFKGSGFYITDYQRGEGYKKAAESDKSGGGTPAASSDAPAAKPAADTGGAAKTESKPSPKSE